MAALDSRLLPLIETLNAVGADWLAFELADSIRRGREMEETTDELSGSRERARGGEYKPIATSEQLGSEPEPIVGDDQIDWAKNYIIKRLEASVMEMSASIENLDKVVGDQEATADATQVGKTVVVFREGEHRREVDQSVVQLARAAVPRLRTALEEWSAQVRGPQT